MTQTKTATTTTPTTLVIPAQKEVGKAITAVLAKHRVSASTFHVKVSIEQQMHYLPEGAVEVIAGELA
jgi:hypothetical protein